MLIESACSVDRVEEALSTLLPMLPEIQYFRFNPGTMLAFGVRKWKNISFFLMLIIFESSFNDLLSLLILTSFVLLV